MLSVQIQFLTRTLKLTISSMKQPYEILSDMVLFVEVARCESLRLAARRWEIAVATRSRRTARMKKQLGLQLLAAAQMCVNLAATPHVSKAASAKLQHLLPMDSVLATTPRQGFASPGSLRGLPLPRLRC